jgi:hypothetical protein
MSKLNTCHTFVKILKKVFDIEINMFAAFDTLGKFRAFTKDQQYTENAGVRVGFEWLVIDDATWSLEYSINHKLPQLDVANNKVMSWVDRL